jgi:hypothetical protein
MGKPKPEHRLPYSREARADPIGAPETVQVWDSKREPSGWPKRWDGLTVRAPVIDRSLGLSHIRTAVLTIRQGRVVSIEWLQEQNADVAEGQARIALEDNVIDYRAPKLAPPPARKTA